MKLPGWVGEFSWLALARDPRLRAAAAARRRRRPTPSGNGERISGSERLGWNQAASDAGELGTFRYAAYVDGTLASSSTDVSCGGASGGPFPAAAGCPTMAPGAHTIELVSFVVDNGNVIESGRSATLRVTVTGVMTGGASPLRPRPAAPRSSRPADGVELRLDVLSEQLEIADGDRHRARRPRVRRRA